MKNITLFEATRKATKKDNVSAGFIMLAMIPAFLVILAFATAIAGCVSCSMQAMVHRNEIVQTYPLLEDDDTTWQEEVLSAWHKNEDDNIYEKVISTRSMGPYVLLIKEFRNKVTGKVLVNRLEFIPIEKSNDHKS
jgi:hypothetical protein